MASGINVDPYGIIPTSSKTLDEQKKLKFENAGIGNILNTPASPFRQGLEKTGATLLTGLGLGASIPMEAVSRMVDNILGTKTPSLVPGNIEAFDKSLQAWNLGIGTPTASAATTPAAAPKVSLSAQAPAGITPPVATAPANETVAKPVTAETSTAASTAVGGIKPYTPPPGWKTTLGVQDFSKYENPTEYRMDKEKGVIEARGIGALRNQPVDETVKGLGIIDKELAKPNLNESTRATLLKERSDLVGHGVAAKERFGYEKANLEAKIQHNQVLEKDYALRLAQQKDIAAQKAMETSLSTWGYHEADPMNPGNKVMNRKLTYFNMAESGENIAKDLQGPVKKVSDEFEDFYKRGLEKGKGKPSPAERAKAKALWMKKQLIFPSIATE